MKYVAGTPSEGFKPVEPGRYPFSVEEATEKISPAGNDMIELKLKLDGGGSVFDNLVATEKSGWKIDQFRDSIGDAVKDGVETEVRARKLIGCRGVAEVGLGTNNKGNPRNEVDRYVLRKEFDESEAFFCKTENDDLDDDEDGESGPF